MFDVLIIAGAIMLFIAGILYGRERDKRAWNNGVAPSGRRWRHFDNDSQGGRGYTDDCGNYIWISYNVDK